MTINARAEEDVEPECIMQKVARASGANYTFHRESSRFQDTGPQAPVVSAAGQGLEHLPGSKTAAPALSPCSPVGWLPPTRLRAPEPNRCTDGDSLLMGAGAACHWHEEQPSTLTSGLMGLPGACDAGCVCSEAPCRDSAATLEAMAPASTT